MSSDMDVDRMIETLRKTEFLREADVRALCTRAKEIIIDESNVQRVDAPVTVRTCSPCPSFLCSAGQIPSPVHGSHHGHPWTAQHPTPQPPLPFLTPLNLFF